MFIGHQGVAFAAKAAAPRANLGTLFLAAMWLDIVWPIFLLLNIEQVRVVPGTTVVSPFDFVSYPYSHSLLFAALWGVVFAALAWWRTRDRVGAVIVGLVVVSHWFLDLIVHRADLALYPGGAKFGLGLWNSWAATLAAEFITFGGGLAIYVWVTQPKDRIGAYALLILAAFLTAMYALSLISTPPPEPKYLAAGSLSVLFLVFWAWWIDRHRTLRP